MLHHCGIYIMGAEMAGEGLTANRAHPRETDPPKYYALHSCPPLSLTPKSDQGELYSYVNAGDLKTEADIL